MHKKPKTKKSSSGQAKGVLLTYKKFHCIWCSFCFITVMSFCASVAVKKRKHHRGQGGTTPKHCHVSVRAWSWSASSEDVMDVTVETSHSYRSIPILRFRKFSACCVACLKQSSPGKLSLCVWWWNASFCWRSFGFTLTHFFIACNPKKKTLPGISAYRRRFLIVLHWADSYIRAQRCHRRAPCTMNSNIY